MPRQFGPRILMPVSFAIVLTCSSGMIPSLPDSLKPAVMMTADFISRAAHSRNACGTDEAGMAMTAKSIGPSGRAMVGYDFTPRISSAFGLMGNRVPW